MIVEIRARMWQRTQIQWMYQVSMTWRERWPSYAPVSTLDRESRLWEQVSG